MISSSIPQFRCLQKPGALCIISSISAIGYINIGQRKRGVSVKASDYVIINNRAYDPITGLPVDGVDIEPKKEIIAKNTSPLPRRGIEMPSIHTSTQHSATLSRRHVRKPKTIMPLSEQTESQPIVAAYSPMSLQQLTVKKAQPVNKFMTAPEAAKPASPRADRPHEAHPITHRAANRSLDVTAPRRQRASAYQKLDTQAKLAPVPAKPVEKKDLKSAHALKNDAIYEAMSREVAPQKRRRDKKQKSQGRWARFMSLSAASLAVVMLAGYFTYLNMPNLSIRMAAVQSGVDAKYPGYSPDGYALSGPISFKEGEVTMRFAYADGNRGFTIKQQKSSWDSSAVRQFVDEQSPNSSTTQVDGLTIYTYDGNAAWVNGGVFYTLQGSAPLSSDQVQRIATSM